MYALYKLVQKKRRERRSFQETSPTHENDAVGQQNSKTELSDASTEGYNADKYDISTCPHGCQKPSESTESETQIQDNGQIVCPHGCGYPTTKSDSKIIKKRRRIYRWKLIAALVIPNILATLDLTIVATASPFVASYFDRVNQISWIATAYTLCYTAFIPSFGQLSDIFGRHAVLQSAMVLMIIGSVLCAAAQDWGMFLLGRAFQGISAAGITNVIKIVLSDKVSLAENAKNTSIFTLIAGISFSVGPVIGGYLTDASWRYCFVLPIPLAVISMILMFFLIRKELVRGSARTVSLWKPGALVSALSTIDFGGTVLFIFGIGLLILATAWGGSTYPWNSAAVLVPLIVGSVLFLCFFFYEYLLEGGRLLNRKFPNQIPMIPWSLFERRDTSLLAFINLASGAAQYSIFYFMGIYFTIAEGYKPSKAGVFLLLYLPGLGVGAYLAIFSSNVWPRQTFWPLLFGSVVECAGISALTWAVTTSRIPLVQGMMALAGVGTGVRFMPNTLHGVGVWPTRIAAVLSLMDFAMPFGGTLSLTIMGSVFNNKFQGYLESLPRGDFSAQTSQSGGEINTKALKDLPLSVRRYYGSRAVMWAWVSILPLMALCVLVALSLGNVWISKKKGGVAKVIYSSFLLACLTGTLKDKVVTNVEPSDLVEEEKNTEEASGNEVEPA